MELRFFSLVLFCFLSIVSSEGQSWFKTFDFTPYAEFAGDVIQTPDQGYVMAGNSSEMPYSSGSGIKQIIISKLDYAGIIEWVKILDYKPGGVDYDIISPHLISMPDGNIIIIATTYNNSNSVDGIVIRWKLDSLGNEIAREVDNNHYYISDIAQTSTDEIICVGMNYDCNIFNCYDYRAFITIDTNLKTSNQGLSYNFDNDLDEVFGVAIMPDGRFVIFGQTYFWNGTEWKATCLLDIMDKDGFVKRTYAIDNLEGNIFFQGHIVSAAEDLVTLTYSQGSSEYFIRQIDIVNGQTLWKEDVNTSDYGFSQVFNRTIDGEYIVAAMVNDSIELIKLNNRGYREWRSILPVLIHTNTDPPTQGQLAPALGAIRQTSDGGFVITGNYRTDWMSIEQHLFLLKTDSQGIYVTYHYGDASTSVCSGEIYDGLFIQHDTIILDTTHFLLYDSITTIDLHTLPSYLSHQESIICEGETIEFANQVLTESGQYIDSHIALNGCDSIISLSLTVINHDSTDLYFDICEGGISPISQSIYPDEGVYTEQYNLQNQYGCDSSVSVLLTVHPDIIEYIDLELPYDTIYNGIEITQDTQFVYHDTTAYGCKHTIIESIVVETTGLENSSIIVSLKVDPNPIRSYFNISFDLKESQRCDVVLSDLSGRSIMEIIKKEKLTPGHYEYPVSVSDLVPGLYFLQFRTSTGLAIKRLAIVN